MEGHQSFTKSPRVNHAAGETTTEFKRELMTVAMHSEQRRHQSRYEQELEATFAVARVLQRQKLPAETFMEYAAALRRTGERYAIPEYYYVVAFINGVGCSETSHLLRESKPENLHNAAKEAIFIERSDGATRSSEHRKRPRDGGLPREQHRVEHRSKRPRRDPVRCNACLELGHIARDCRNSGW